ncbi:MAG: GNAT family N-acetyltransferase [Inquilinus sp.]|nr:GNAT family N-acetyltransferase [Inquilinus sp.]
MSGVTTRIDRISADTAFPLRANILRAALPPEESRYPQDDWPETLHIGGFLDDRLVCVASFLPEAQEPGEPSGAFRLRGMVTVPEYRGRGIGGAVLDRGIADLIAAGARLLWCNGRTGAVEFYARHGFRRVGEEFETPGTGPHYRFLRPLAATAAGFSSP